MLGGDEEKDPDAAKKEEERQEALRQEEEERKAKYAKMEAEREAMRQGIRDKVGPAARRAEPAGTSLPGLQRPAWVLGPGIPDWPWIGGEGLPGRGRVEPFLPLPLCPAPLNRPLDCPLRNFRGSRRSEVTASQVSTSATEPHGGLERPLRRMVLPSGVGASQAP